ncbi:Sulfatase-modifying factor enzyme domain-containing protein [Desulfonema limicola]|uniref:Sulfatase-modifying factor enzyme domain-containing protein n=1 Tax=Desulfonema limicola TaxID=45656 RepID=A0A975BD21_9BACT|nr:formylglycine-generating enzyme family protein [Desulfonema limicola]QTA83108.1 Sulfatase-modifying factor enzyme domain-containing protein [Desulfonema limicola]
MKRFKKICSMQALFFISVLIICSAACSAALAGAALDVDGNGTVDGATDALLVNRYVHGFRGASLIAGAVGSGCTRCSALDIETYLAAMVASGDGGDTYTNGLGMTFKNIPAGTFMMGSPAHELGRSSDENQHQVTLTKSFYIQTTEVTQAQWTSVMGSNPSDFTACGNNCPVESVSWNDVQDFITKMNLRGEGTYRLPTEAEWEYSARAGSTTAFTNGGITNTSCDTLDSNLNIIGWYCGNANSTVHTVSQKQANAWGLYDMHGNVWEWCQDWYGTYPADAVSDPAGPFAGEYRVKRGGSWYGAAQYCRSADRGSRYPSGGSYSIGFRLVLSQVSR